jgi:NADH-quinone oxidoreductase subunit A
MQADMTTIPESLLLYAALVLTVAGGMLLLSHVLGERHRERSTGRPYESGIEPTGNARGRIPAEFYRVGLLFVIFELESVFVYAWAVAARDAGWSGYAGILIFLGILLVALFYLWRIGALDWEVSKAPRKTTADQPEKPT